MIAKLPFGRTGHPSSRAIFGGVALRRASPAIAEETLDRLLSYGINHIDTAAGYGESESLLGTALLKSRADLFIATKTAHRTHDGARADLHRSLERLRVDRIDLMQLHCVTDPLEWHVAFGAHGALEALVEAREDGLIRFLGVTGHGEGVLSAILRSLAVYDFDSVMFPYNHTVANDPAQSASLAALLAVCRDRNIAMQAIKTIARGPWPEGRATKPTWYEPLQREDDINLTIRWAAHSQPDMFLCTVGDLELLWRMCDALADVPPEADLLALDAAISKLDLRSPFG